MITISRFIPLTVLALGLAASASPTPVENPSGISVAKRDEGSAILARDGLSADLEKRGGGGPSHGGGNWWQQKPVPGQQWCGYQWGQIPWNVIPWTVITWEYIPWGGISWTGHSGPNPWPGEHGHIKRGNYGDGDWWKQTPVAGQEWCGYEWGTIPYYVIPWGVITVEFIPWGGIDWEGYHGEHPYRHDSTYLLDKRGGNNWGSGWWKQTPVPGQEWCGYQWGHIPYYVIPWGVITIEYIPWGGISWEGYSGAHPHRVQNTYVFKRGGRGGSGQGGGYGGPGGNGGGNWWQQKPVPGQEWCGYQWGQIPYYVIPWGVITVEYIPWGGISWQGYQGPKPQQQGNTFILGGLVDKVTGIVGGLLGGGHKRDDIVGGIIGEVGGLLGLGGDKRSGGGNWWQQKPASGQEWCGYQWGHIPWNVIPWTVITYEYIPWAGIDWSGYTGGWPYHYHNYKYYGGSDIYLIGKGFEGFNY